MQAVLLHSLPIVFMAQSGIMDVATATAAAATARDFHQIWWENRMVKETPDTRSQCRITACLLHRKQKKKENSALYYYEVYGVMPSGFSCTSRESGRDKGVPASGAQHETDENTVL